MNNNIVSILEAIRVSRQLEVVYTGSVKAQNADPPYNLVVSIYSNFKRNPKASCGSTEPK